MKLLYILLILTLFSNPYAKDDLKRLENVISSHPQREVLDLPNHDFRLTNLDMDDLLSFKGSNFEKANFSGTLQKPKIITNIDFSNCNLNGADFSYTIITKCKFNNAQGLQANFKGSTLKFSSFHSIFLSDSNFTDTNQESVGFDSANLQCSVWDNANIFRLSFTRSDERGMVKKNIKESHCSHENAITTKFMENFQCPASK
jgi:uncharacterized protein YjbI with pentapeptide repeats